MLTAYSFQEYNERIHDTGKIKGGALFEREVDIAHRFTMKHQETDQLNHACPICKSTNKVLFFEKWGIRYYRCSQCFSVFAGVDPEVAFEYESSSELTEFYQSEEYQKTDQNKEKNGGRKSLIGYPFEPIVIPRRTKICLSRI